MTKPKATDLNEHLRAISRRGVEARRAKRAAALVGAEWPLPGPAETVRDWQKVGAWAARAMVEGKIAPQVAKELSSLTRAALAAFKLADLADQLDAATKMVEILLTMDARTPDETRAKLAELRRSWHRDRAEAPAQAGMQHLTSAEEATDDKPDVEPVRAVVAAVREARANPDTTPLAHADAEGHSGQEGRAASSPSADSEGPGAATSALAVRVEPLIRPPDVDLADVGAPIPADASAGGAADVNF